MRVLVLIGLLVALLAPFRHAQAQDEVGWLLEQINAVRASAGLPGYALNGTLSSAALAHSQWMAGTGNISHTEDNGSTPGSRAAAWGYGGSRVSENIYGGMMATAAIALNFWINSPIHYAGLTSADKNEIGIGIHNGYYTLLFGRSGGYTSAVPQLPAAPPEQPSAAQEQAQAPAQNQAPALQNAIAAAPTNPPPPPTRALPTWTPSPTIPTATPTLTWTPTFTWTPSPTASEAPATSTPMPISMLPTIPVIQLAALSSDTPEPTAQPDTQVMVMQPTPVLVQDQESGFDWRLMLPVLVVAQVMIFGVSIWWLFLRRR